MRRRSRLVVAGLLAFATAASLGMVAACNISVRRAGFQQPERDRVVELLSRLQLPTHLPRDFAGEKAFSAIMQDKKFEAGEVRFVVTPRIGQAYVSREVTLHDIREAIEKL